MKIRIGLLLIFWVNVTFGQQTEIRQLCVDALFQLKDSIDYLILTDPYFKDKLEFGVVNVDSLSIAFAYKPALKTNSKKKPGEAQRKTIIPYVPVTQGIQFRFKHPLHRPIRNFARTYEWHFLDIKLTWHWSWPIVRFDPKHQKKVMLELRKAVQPISTYEQASFREQYSSASDQGFVVEGTDKLELHLQRGPDTPDGKIDLYARTTSRKPIYLINEFLFDWIVDDSIYNHQIPYGFLMYPQSKNEDPFVKVPSKEMTYLQTIYIPALPEGTHTLRLVCSFNTDGWMDYRPTWADGLPVYRVRENVWMGRVVSGSVETSN